MSDFTVVDAVGKQQDKRRIAELEQENKRFRQALSKIATAHEGWVSQIARDVMREGTDND